MKDNFIKNILKGKKIAILATDGFEQSELFVPKEALEKAGAKVDIVSLKGEAIRSWNKNDWGKKIEVDALVEDCSPDSYDGLMIPGGVINPDILRMNESAIYFAKSFLESGKPVAAICHGPQLLIETGLLKGRRMTSYMSIRTDLINAGANWVDEEVVTDSGLITSRNPGDLNAFTRKIIEEFEEISDDRPNFEGWTATL